MSTTITKRDRLILRFLEEHHALTIMMCAKIFMNDCNQSYKIAQRRLNRLVEAGYLRSCKTDSGENMYYMDKKLSYHDLLINGFYAELCEIGAQNIKWEKPKYWLDKEIRSDAFFSYEYGNYIYYNILEVALTHKKIPLENYERLYDSYEAHNQCKGTFPKIVVVDDVDHKENYYFSSRISIVQIGTNFKNLPLILID